MEWNVISCSTWRLYVIADRAAVGPRDLAAVAAAAVRGGADVFQLRDKAGTDEQIAEAALRILPITRAAGVALIINDRVGVARQVGAEGVHLGQDDLPIEDARAILGPNRLIGASTHSLDQAMDAVEAGADYIAVGPIFPTPTKPEYASVGTELITEVAPRIRIPWLCIGGIDLHNVQQVLAAGARCVAVVRAVCGAEDPEQATRELACAVKQLVRTGTHADL
jgi:thiamine-phosphate pyrophosphorylase